MVEVVITLQIASTLAMTGLIWFVQVVHYPLFERVGSESFADYERVHQQRTTWVVAPLMLAEAATALLLLFLSPGCFPLPAAATGLTLLVAIWTSTFFWQVPAHIKLGNAFDLPTHRWLVRSNWIRTAAWTTRSLLCCWFLAPTAF